jgi:hypothetical protein
MATRAQIDRIARQVDKLVSVLNEANTTYVPIYQQETEAEALKACRQSPPGSVTFNRARPGDQRQACEANGLHAFYCLGPSEVRRVLVDIDGMTRGIPTIGILTSERETTV